MDFSRVKRIEPVDQARLRRRVKSESAIDWLSDTLDSPSVMPLFLVPLSRAFAELPETMIRYLSHQMRERHFGDFLLVVVL